MEIEIYGDTFSIEDTGQQIYINNVLLNEYIIRKEIKDEDKWFQVANMHGKSTEEIINKLTEEYEDEIFGECEEEKEIK